MAEFIVWDPNDSSRETAVRILGCKDAEDAAEEYTKGDVDGMADNAYGDGLDLHVEDESGQLHIVNVTVEWDPTFYCRERDRA